MLLCAIDPGLRHCSYALFDGAVLRQAGLVHNPAKTGNGPAAWVEMGQAVARALDASTGAQCIGQLVIEGQKVYQASRQGRTVGADPNDLIELSGVCGVLAVTVGEVAEVRRVMPSDWKGTTDKTICQLRVNKRLSDSEQLAILWPGAAGKDSALAHNVYDAIGIGLHAVGRWSK